MTTSIDTELQSAIEALYASPQRSIAALDLLTTVRQRLSEGTLRVALPPSDAPQPTGVDRRWQVVPWVKKAMLLMNSLGQPARTPAGGNAMSGIELDTTPWLQAPPPHCRMPAGSLVREGAHIAEGVVCMPPSVLQMGCHVGKGAVIDSMVMVGLGAQIGAGAQVSCGSVIGGYILPLEALPTIVEDGVLMGSDCAVYDGAQIGHNALLLAGTQIVPSLGVYDLRTQSMLPLQDGVLRIPPGAIVGPGTRPVGSSGVQLRTAVLIGQRNGPQRKDWELYADVAITGG